MAARGNIFRGSELPRLLLLGAVALCGWVFVLYKSMLTPAPPPQPKTEVPAQALAKVEPDTSPAFKGLLDRQPLNLRDNAAYTTLLERVRETPSADLARKSRRDILYTHLFETPELYRGVPIHLEGTARKALTYEVGPNLSPKERLYEIWMFTRDSWKNPYAIVCEDLPKGFRLGAELNERVIVDGYFLKLMAYQAGDVPRAAPLLVGRAQWVHYPQFERKDEGQNTLNWMVAGTLLLTVYALIRLAFHLRSKYRPTARKPSERAVETIEPEALNEWLGQEEEDKYSLHAQDEEDEA